METRDVQQQRVYHVLWLEKTEQQSTCRLEAKGGFCGNFFCRVVSTGDMLFYFMADAKRMRTV